MKTEKFQLRGSNSVCAEAWHPRSVEGTLMSNLAYFPTEKDIQIFVTLINVQCPGH
jgi:hypothetical protein